MKYKGKSMSVCSE